MTRGPGHRDKRLGSCADVPHGTPAWISLELVERTIAVWQPYYAEPLTIEEAIAIIERAGRLMELLSRDSMP